MLQFSIDELRVLAEAWKLYWEGRDADAAVPADPALAASVTEKLRAPKAPRFFTRDEARFEGWKSGPKLVGRAGLSAGWPCRASRATERDNCCGQIPFRAKLSWVEGRPRITLPRLMQAKTR